MTFDKFSKPFWWTPIIIVIIKYLTAFKGGLISEGIIFNLFTFSKNITKTLSSTFQQDEVSDFFSFDNGTKVVFSY